MSNIEKHYRNKIVIIIIIIVIIIVTVPSGSATDSEMMVQVEGVCN